MAEPCSEDQPASRPLLTRGTTFNGYFICDAVSPDWFSFGEGYRVKTPNGENAILAVLHADYELYPVPCDSADILKEFVIGEQLHVRGTKHDVHYIIFASATEQDWRPYFPHVGYGPDIRLMNWLRIAYFYERLEKQFLRVQVIHPNNTFKSKSGLIIVGLGVAPKTTGSQDASPSVGNVFARTVADDLESRWAMDNGRQLEARHVKLATDLRALAGADNAPIVRARRMILATMPMRLRLRDRLEVLLRHVVGPRIDWIGKRPKQTGALVNSLIRFLEYPFPAIVVCTAAVAFLVGRAMPSWTTFILGVIAGAITVGGIWWWRQRAKRADA